MKVFYKNVQLNPTTETDYTDLINKPAINGVELEGDLSTEQIKVTWFGTQAEFDALPSHDPYTFYIIDDGTPVGEQEDYLDLANKPSINGQVLTGNKLSNDIGMYTKEEVDNMMASLRSIKVASELPVAPIANTMYYIGPDSEGVYMVYLYDALLTRIDLGPSVQKLYDAGKAIHINTATNVIDVKYDDVSIKTNASNELYVPTSKSGDRFNVYPYVTNDGELTAGRTLRFYKTDGATTNSSKIEVLTSNGTSGKTGDLMLTNADVAARSGGIVTTGTIDGSTIKYDSTNGKVYAAINNNTIKGTDTTLPVDEAAIQHFTRTLTIAGATIIPDNANLNTATYTKPGRYAVTNNTSAATITNSPTMAAFVMEVENNLTNAEDAQGSGYSTRARRLWAHDGSSKFVQSLSCNSSGTITYGAWKRVPLLEGTIGGTAKPVYVNSGSISAISATVGSTGRPVYLNGGTITQCSTPESGAWYKGVPYITTGGVMEIGNIIDFHTDSSTNDYDTRLVRTATNGGFYGGSKVGDLIVLSNSNSARSGVVLTTGNVFTDETSDTLSWTNLQSQFTVVSDSIVKYKAGDLALCNMELKTTTSLTAGVEYRVLDALKLGSTGFDNWVGMGCQRTDTSAVGVTYNGTTMYLNPTKNVVSGDLIKVQWIGTI